MDDLATTRLTLHLMSPAEVADLAAGEPGGNLRWTPGYPSDGEKAAARRYLNTCETVGDPRPFGSFAIIRREDEQVIGGAGFHGAPDERGQVTIGYGLAPTARGKGYASEALRALLEFARSQGVTSAKGDADLDNIGSHRVMTAAGMRLVGVDDQLHHYRVELTGDAPQEALDAPEARDPRRT
ncbi:GNAT family N-acetyltransferase [Streptomyces finlayi]|uniref:GNAT family N-acetyltransferase n=1 Tax=Streptomyces finlayi TaxID=67296 RepID=A0A7G7BUK4_9ACTN|nr:GNAT family N-acetyltransferase [Streptomyces finlayi]QNE79019.1 GNAT family N-acetyltransferase [Streptomyces finlayi]